MLDDEQPVLSLVPNPVTVTCPEDVPAPFASLDEFRAAGGVATDFALRENSFTLIDETESATTCPKTIERTYWIEDLCGQSTTWTHRITVSDQIAPTISCPPEISVMCLSEAPKPFTTLVEFIAAGGNAGDLCGIDTNSFRMVSSATVILSNKHYVARRYSISDFCGNEASCVHNIQLNDTIPPVAVCNAITYISMKTKSRSLGH